MTSSLKCECGGRFVFRYVTQEFECQECGKSQLMFCTVEQPDQIASAFVPDGDNYGENSFP